MAPDSPVQHLFQERPEAGLWKIVVDGYAVPSHGAPFRLRDYYLVPGLAHSSNEHSTPAVTVAAFANDPLIILGLTETTSKIIWPRPGLNPIIFDVLLKP